MSDWSSDVCSSDLTASTIFGWQCPAFTHHRPAEESITCRPSGVRKYILSAPTTSRGSFLYCRFDVNGMKKASRSLVSMWASVLEDMAGTFPSPGRSAGRLARCRQGATAAPGEPASAPPASQQPRALPRKEEHSTTGHPATDTGRPAER